MMNFICDYKELHGDKQLSLLDNLNYKTSRKVTGKPPVPTLNP